jgi:hypothetical protein
MKATFVTLLAVVFWVLIGHFFSSFSISITAFYLPILFVLVAFTIGKRTNKYIYTLVSFVLLLLQDYLFRLYGGGIHDDLGRAICEIVFYATLLTSTIALLVVKLLDSNIKNELKHSNRPTIKKTFVDVFFVLAISIITLLFFRKFNVLM